MVIASVGATMLRMGFAEFASSLLNGSFPTSHTGTFWGSLEKGP